MTRVGVVGFGTVLVPFVSFVYSFSVQRGVVVVAPIVAC